MDTWMHQFKATRPYHGKGYASGATIEVEAGLHQLGEQRPYFSVTVAVYTLSSKLRNDCEACGCLQDEVLKVWPKLAPIVALHLSDIDGIPMHADANGWYWLAGYYGGAGETYHGGNSSPAKSQEECLQILANHVRIPLEQARELADRWKLAPEHNDRVKWLYMEWMQQQRPRWKDEAEAAITLLDELRGSHGRP